MDIKKLAKMSESQLYLGMQIIEICQDLMDELEGLCLKLGIELTRTQIIDIVRLRFNDKLNELKLKLPPEEEKV